jgi:hypothetical protein
MKFPKQCALAVGSVFIILPLGLFGEGLRFSLLQRSVVEERLKSFSRDDTEREEILKKAFLEAGCGDHLSENPVKHVKQPNLICILPGQSPEVVFVGAHFDHVNEGQGVADNWSGAALLPSLYQGLRGTPRQYTYVFIAFTGEERGELGSEAYVKNMTKQQVALSRAMVNLDTLGLGPTKVWLSHSDKRLPSLLNRLANAMKLPLGAVNVDGVGSSDSEQFAKRKIPRITVHSITQETLPILHSSRDTLQSIHLDDYYATYQLLAGYLVLLDNQLSKESD